ncbi:MAG: hypothetical protein LQ347_004597, partial [Umbilicaria vellea]
DSHAAPQLVVTTSGLALVPVLRCPNYSASKAALHHFILCLREQLKGDQSESGRALEIHDEKHQPDIKNCGRIGMPLNQFTQEADEGLAAGKGQVPVGTSKQSSESWEKERQRQFHGMIRCYGWDAGGAYVILDRGGGVDKDTDTDTDTDKQRFLCWLMLSFRSTYRGSTT